MVTDAISDSDSDVDNGKFDKYGNINEEPVSTIGFPIEAASYFSGASKRHLYKNNGPFALLDMQCGPGELGYRAFETGGYLNLVHNISTNDGYIESDKNYCLRINDEIKPEDYDFAATIRDYYKSMFTMQRLQNHPLNEWQKEVSCLVSRDDQQSFKLREVGLISKLVQAYEIDQETDRCVGKWGQSYLHNAPFINGEARCRAVGAVYGLQKNKIHLFTITGFENYLVEIELCDSPLNKFFINTIRRRRYPEFILETGKIKTKTRNNGKSWYKVYQPEINVA